MIKNGDGSIARLVADGLCPRCHTAMQPVEVHGHYQCSVCQLVINECCQGERADNEKGKGAGDS